MILFPTQLRLVPPPRLYVIIHYAINIIGNNHVVDPLVYTLHWCVTLWVFIEVYMGIMENSYNKGVIS